MSRARGEVRRVTRDRDARTPAGSMNLIHDTWGPPAVSRGVLRWRTTISRTVAFATAAGTVTASSLLGGMWEGVVPVALATAFIVWMTSRVRQVRRRTLAAQHKDDPWNAIPYWRSRVVALPAWQRCAPLLGPLVVSLAVAAWMALDGLLVPTFARLGVGVALGLWCAYLAYRLQNAMFLGMTEVRLREVPMRARAPVVMDFAVGPRGADFESIKFVLMRLVDVPGIRSAIMGPESWAGTSHWGEYELPSNQPPPAPGEQVEVHFQLPTNASGTDLTRDLPVYWMLEVTGDTSCGRYSERFPIPIYDLPAEGETAGTEPEPRSA